MEFVAGEALMPASSRATAARGGDDTRLAVLWRQQEYLMDALLSLFYFDAQFLLLAAHIL